MLNRIKSKHMITFLDTCHSAATVNRKEQNIRNMTQEFPFGIFSGTGRVMISASDGIQPSLELDEYQHGIFTYYLLKGLKGEADDDRDGVIDVDEIWKYVNSQVTETAKEVGTIQTPVFQATVTDWIPLTFNIPLLLEKVYKDTLLSPKN
jgi:uncharacterized caspase-like protein